MIIFHTNYTDVPMGQLHGYLGDTITYEFLTDPSTAEAVLNAVGIRKEPYEKAATESELKELMFTDINKLKSYLSGPGATDERFKKEVRDRVGMRFSTVTINSIQNQQWQKFVLKSDNLAEYEKMKGSLRDLKTSALYTAISFDEQNMAVVVETSNTIMTLDKQNNDGSVRVVNIKGKDGRVINYSEVKPYGAIESNSNWIAGDLYTWLRGAGFEASQLITERKYELGLDKGDKPERPVTFREGKKHALEIVEQDEKILLEAQRALAGLGVIEGEAAESQKIDEATVGSEEKVEPEPIEGIQQKEAVEQPVEKEEKPLITNEPEKPIDSVIVDEVRAGIDSLVRDKMLAETAIIQEAAAHFTKYSELFDKYLSTSKNFAQAKQKTWDEFRELRSRPNAAQIEKHLGDLLQQRMFLQNKMFVGLKNEVETLRNNGAVLKNEIALLNGDKTRLQGEFSNTARELNLAQIEVGKLTEINSQNEETIDEFQKELVNIMEMVENLKSERDQYLVFKDENVRLQNELSGKDRTIATLNDTNESMAKAQERLSESLIRIEKDADRAIQESASIAKERDVLSEKLNNAIQESASIAKERDVLSEKPQVSQSIDDKKETTEAPKPIAEEIQVLEEMVTKAVEGLPKVRTRSFDRSRLAAASDRLKEIGADLSKSVVPDPKN